MGISEIKCTVRETHLAYTRVLPEEADEGLEA